MTLQIPLPLGDFRVGACFGPWQAAPALSRQGDLDLLQSYVGDWQGRGTLGVNDKHESVKCSLAVTSSEPTRVQFNGRCALAGGTITLKGTMGYFEERNQFEAVLNSEWPSPRTDRHRRRAASGIVFTIRPKDPETNTDIDMDVD